MNPPCLLALVSFSLTISSIPSTCLFLRQYVLINALSTSQLATYGFGHESLGRYTNMVRENHTKFVKMTYPPNKSQSTMFIARAMNPSLPAIVYTFGRVMESRLMCPFEFNTTTGLFRKHVALYVPQKCLKRSYSTQCELLNGGEAMNLNVRMDSSGLLAIVFSTRSSGKHFFFFSFPC